MVQLKIKQVTGQDTFPVQVDLEGTVADLKAAVAAAAECETGALRLIYRGQILKDDKSLASYGGCWCWCSCCWTGGCSSWLAGAQCRRPPLRRTASPQKDEPLSMIHQHPTQHPTQHCTAELAEDHVVHMVRSKQQGGARCAALRCGLGGRGCMGRAACA